LVVALALTVPVGTAVDNVSGFGGATPDCESVAVQVDVWSALCHWPSALVHATDGPVLSTLVDTVAVDVCPTKSVAVMVYVVAPAGGVMGPVTAVVAPLPA
jgi:hypothetical protein